MYIGALFVNISNCWIINHKYVFQVFGTVGQCVENNRKCKYPNPGGFDTI